MVTADGMDRRPFGSLEDMHETLKERWNARVTDTDDVYVLGDMVWTENAAAVEWVGGLRGCKHLIRGNHDRLRDSRLARQFAEVRSYLEVDDELEHQPRLVVLSHFPIMFWNHQHQRRWDGEVRRDWAVHLYGHVHSSREERIYQLFLAILNHEHGIRCLARNVGCMMPWMDYTPRTLAEICAGDENVV